MRPVEADPDKCLFQWLLDTDIKVSWLLLLFLLLLLLLPLLLLLLLVPQGWIPQSIIDKALSGTQFEYIANIRLRAASLKGDPGLLDTSLASCADLTQET